MARYHNMNALSWIEWAKTDLIQNKGNVRVLLNADIPDGVISQLDNNEFIIKRNVAPTETVEWSVGIFKIKMWHYQDKKGLSVSK